MSEPNKFPNRFTKDTPNTFNRLSKEEAFAIQSKGGKVSAERKRRNKTIAKAILTILAMPETDREKKAKLNELFGDTGTKMDSMAFSAIECAINGDVDAMRFVRDTIGEKPVAGVAVGNLDGQPLATVDLSQLSDAELMRIADERAEQEDEE